MGMPTTHMRKRNLLTLKLVVDKLQRSLYSSKRLSSSLTHGPGCRGIEFGRKAAQVPKDVKEGHFAVLAMDDGRSKRFVVSLRYLSHPQFRRLLEQAAEEYGFDHEGALAIPCRPSELERILGEQWKGGRRGDDGGREVFWTQVIICM